MRTLADGLTRAFQGATDVLVVHTDITGVPFVFGGRSQTLEGHAAAIVSASEGRMVAVPTFNYDYCESGAYDPYLDPAQTGVLNEYLRLHYCTYRTRTPVFNFGVVPGADVAYPPQRTLTAHDPFGEQSMFRWLIHNQATVVAYGCRTRYASALHVAEHEVRVPYRYVKPFPGTVDGEPYTLYYQVAPPGNAVEYDWRAVEDIIAPAFERHMVGGRGCVQTANMVQVHRLLVRALEHDEHAFLKRAPEPLYAEYGKPLTFHAVEVAA